MIVGITGKIGSGKSSLLNLLDQNGYNTISMDEIGHEVLEESENTIRKMFNIDNTKDLRSSLRNIVFNDKNKLKMLNSKLHPLMKEKLKKLLKESKKSPIFVEAAILFEMKINDLMDKIVYLDVQNKIAIERVKKRSNLPEKDVIKIIKSQKSYEEIKDLIDIYIDTSNKTKDEIYKILINKLNLEVKNAG